MVPPPVDPPLSILLVDDRPESLLALEAALAGLGQGLVTARSGQEALRLCLDADYALILLDVNMPGLDGYETAQAIRARDRSRFTPIIFLTATHLEEVQVFEGYSRGAVDYLFKPLDPEILRSKVRVFVELARQRQQLLTLNAALERHAFDLGVANRDLEAFAHSVSHDLRAPIRAIQGFARILVAEHAEDLAPAAQGHLRQIVASAAGMGALIEDILTLSRVTRTEIRRVPVDLSMLAQVVVLQLELAEPARDIRCDIAPGLRASADPGLARVLLDNLLGNAWKYTRRRPEARIRMDALASQDGKPIYFVRDNGSGFDMKFSSKLFSPFQRLHAESEFEGTGVGLATVHRIVQRHGGRVWAESAPDEGATFYFTLGA